MDTDGRSPTLTFLGGAGTVTGSKTLLDTDQGRLLVDGGLFQGRKELRLQNWSDLPVPPESIDAVLLTHAHIDHCGYLPRLVRDGFAGPVYCTEGTRRLTTIVLPDSCLLYTSHQERFVACGSRARQPGQRPQGASHVIGPPVAWNVVGSPTNRRSAARDVARIMTTRGRT